jgi:hypothetical protein
MKIQGLFTAGSLLLVVCAPLARTNVIVVPNTLTTVEGNDNNLVPSSTIRWAISKSTRPRSFPRPQAR